MLTQRAMPWCAVLVLALTSAAEASADDKVYLRLLDFPEAGRPTRWAVRAKLGNCNRGAVGTIAADVPLSGDTSFGLRTTPSFEWAFRQGTVTFAGPGPANVTLKVRVTTCPDCTCHQTKVLDLQQEQQVAVYSAADAAAVGGEGEPPQQPLAARPAAAEPAGSGRGDWQVELKLFGFPRVGQPIDWSVRGSLGNQVSNVRCEISALEKLQGKTTSAMTEQFFGNWHGAGTVTFTRAGPTSVKASISMTQYGNVLILSKDFDVTVAEPVAAEAFETRVDVDERTSEGAEPQASAGDVDVTFGESWAARGGCNTLSAFSRDLRVTYNISNGNPAMFRFLPVYDSNHTGEKVVIIDDPLNKQYILRGDEEQVFPEQAVPPITLFEFHWLSGNAKYVRICW